MIEPGKEGLQVDTSNGWVDAPALPGAFVVDIGELMEFATDGYLKATVHRVSRRRPARPACRYRSSSTPRSTPPCPASTCRPSSPVDARGVGQDPGNRISGTFGDNLLKARLRAHPDVAAEHHPDLVTPAAKTGP